MLVDSHCHLHMLDLSLFDDNMDNVIQQAGASDVGYFLCVSTTLDDAQRLEALAARYPNVKASVGIHPNEPFTSIDTLALLANIGAKSHIIAIGETGLDYYRSPEADAHLQQTRFREHIEIAKQVKKPLIVHSRAAPKDTIALLTENNAKAVGGVMHCFCETWAVAKQAMDCGFYISISGIVTFKNARELQDVAKRVPLDRLLIETDCPFLAPTPHRGKPNQPAYVRLVAEAIAELRGIDYARVAEQTTDNFFTCFPGAKCP